METLLIEVEKYVVTLINEKLDKSYLYHNLSHTQRVVAKTQELIDGIQINETDAQLLLIAVWFHDTGYTISIDKHEEKSVTIAETFLKKHTISENDIKTISDLILATQLNHKPKNLNEKIIRDADCSHMGNKNFSDLSELLRKEWELTCNRTLSEAEWLDVNIDFSTNKHRFYTDYASANWEKIKSKNLARLLKSKTKLKQENAKFKLKKEGLTLKKNRVKLPERGIETMFRVALRNHITLSDIADTKANILLSINAIIISVALSSLIPKLDNPSNHYLIIPSVIFVLFTVASIVLSVLATRPNVTKGKFNKQDVIDRKVNLLFFGNFHQMKLEEFEWAMREMMQDRDYLYGSLTKDLYFLGLVLNRKYSILRLTYSVFLIGIIVSVISFAIAFQYS